MIVIVILFPFAIKIWWLVGFLVFLFSFETGSCHITMDSLEFVYRPGWPGIHRGLPFSVSRMLGLKTSTTISIQHESFDFIINHIL